MDALSQVPLTLATKKAGLGAGTTTTFSFTANPLEYAIKGKFYSKATQTNAATPTTDAVTGAAFVALTAGYGSVYVFGYDAAGNIKVMQGKVEALDSQGNFVYAPQFPLIPDSICPFGYLVAKGGATLSGSWTFGASNLSGVSGMTYAFQDVLTLPDRPQVS